MKFSLTDGREPAKSTQWQNGLDETHNTQTPNGLDETQKK
jgi:hypothetical protein